MASHIIVRLATANDVHHIDTILSEIETSGKARGTGICRRSHQQLAERIKKSHAVMAVTPTEEWAGFCYIKAWDDARFVSTCALIVSPLHRNANVGTRLKEAAFQLARAKYPQAKLFGLTTSLAVMKMNTALGFKPVTYTEITRNDSFWDACGGCPNQSILLQKERKNCLCTAMLYDAAAAVQSSSHRQHLGVFAADETSLQKNLSPLGVAR